MVTVSRMDIATIIVRVMAVIVVVCVGRGPAAEKLNKGRVCTDLVGVAMTADMLVETDNFVRGRHHQMQIVGDHQYAAIQPIPELPDQAIKTFLADHVNPLNRFIEYQ